jgi:hypothetical protein
MAARLPTEEEVRRQLDNEGLHAVQGCGLAVLLSLLIISAFVLAWVIVT